MRIRVPRELVSPNRWGRMHWGQRNRLRQEWEHDIWALLTIDDRMRLRIAGGTVRRMRVEVTRDVPSGRNLIKDDDNLTAACKPLLDALKRLKLIHDDRREFLYLVPPGQRVIGGKQHWTDILIEEIAR